MLRQIREKLESIQENIDGLSLLVCEMEDYDEDDMNEESLIRLHEAVSKVFAAMMESEPYEIAVEVFGSVKKG